MKTVEIVKDLSRKLVLFRIVMKTLELYRARLKNTTTSEIVKGTRRAMVGDAV